MRKCLIIGGGVSGLLTAYNLYQAGFHQITILEKTTFGRESSWAGGGIISPLYPWRMPEPITRLSLYSQTMYPDFCKKLHKESKIDPEFLQSGFMVFEPKEQHLAKAWADTYNIECELLENYQARQLVAGLNIDSPAIYFPHIAQVRNPRLIKALIKSLHNKKVNLLGNHVVVKFQKKGDSIQVITTQGVFESDIVVVTTGAWTKGLLPKVEITPVRGQMIVFKAIPDLLKSIILQQDHYLIPRKDGRILSGSTVEIGTFEKTTTEDAKQYLSEKAYQLLPSLKNCAIEHHWAGLRPGSYGGIPYIGAYSELPGVYVNAGHYRNGIVLGLASARLITDVITSTASIFEEKDYSLQAIREGAL